MFTIDFDSANSLMLVRFGGIFSADDFATLDELSDTFIADKHPTSIIYDFTAVETLAIAPDVVAMRARQELFCSRLRRAVIAPQAEIFGLVRLYGAYQAAAGFEAPMMASSMDEALALLEARDPHYEPVATSWVVAVEPRDPVAATH